MQHGESLEEKNSNEKKKKAIPAIERPR